jgi:hypothetical protein
MAAGIPSSAVPAGMTPLHLAALPELGGDLAG